MKKEDAIKYLQQIYPNGGNCWLDERRIEAIGMAIKALQEEPVSDDLEEASKNYALNNTPWDDCKDEIQESFKAGTKWQKEHSWKSADGNDLPETDREVIAILDNGKVVFVHRPNPNGWDGKSITTGKAEHFVPQTYGDGGWNIPDVKFWLDVELPKEIEL